MLWTEKTDPEIVRKIAKGIFTRSTYSIKQAMMLLDIFDNANDVYNFIAMTRWQSADEKLLRLVHLQQKKIDDQQQQIDLLKAQVQGLFETLSHSKETE